MTLDLCELFQSLILIQETKRINVGLKVLLITVADSRGVERVCSFRNVQYVVSSIMKGVFFLVI